MHPSFSSNNCQHMADLFLVNHCHVPLRALLPYFKASLRHQQLILSSRILVCFRVRSTLLFTPATLATVPRQSLNKTNQESKLMPSNTYLLFIPPHWSHKCLLTVSGLQISV